MALPNPNNKNIPTNKPTLPQSGKKSFTREEMRKQLKTIYDKTRYDHIMTLEEKKRLPERLFGSAYSPKWGSDINVKEIDKRIQELKGHKDYAYRKGEGRQVTSEYQDHIDALMELKKKLQ